jgi:hypothetical protein
VTEAIASLQLVPCHEVYPIYSVSRNAALVLVCSLAVLALHFSLHQERAHMGASHGRFWSLAGGIQERSLLAISTLWPAAMYRFEQGSLFWPQRASESRNQAHAHKGYVWCRAKRWVRSKNVVGNRMLLIRIRLTYLDLRLVHIFRLEAC